MSSLKLAGYADIEDSEMYEYLNTDVEAAEDEGNDAEMYGYSNTDDEGGGSDDEGENDVEFEESKSESEEETDNEEDCKYFLEMEKVERERSDASEDSESSDDDFGEGYPPVACNYCKYNIKPERVEWLRKLSTKPVKEQRSDVKNGSVHIIKDLQKLMKFTKFNKYVRLNSKERHFLMKNRDFLHCFCKGNRHYGAKRKHLLTKVRGGFLGLLIPTLLSVVGSVIPALLEK